MKVGIYNRHTNGVNVDESKKRTRDQSRGFGENPLKPGLFLADVLDRFRELCGRPNFQGAVGNLPG